MTGILQPNLAYKFKVRFLDANKQPLPFSDELSAQVISCSGFSMFILSGSKNKIVFEDDVTNKAIKAILKLQCHERFTIAIDTLGVGDAVTRTTYFIDTALGRTKFPNLDYAAGSKATASLDVRFPAHVGTITDLIDANPLGAALLHALQGAQLNVKVGEDEAKIANEFVCEFFFNDVHHEFPD